MIMGLSLCFLCFGCSKEDSIARPEPESVAVAVGQPESKGLAERIKLDTNEAETQRLKFSELDREAQTELLNSWLEAGVDINAHFRPQFIMWCLQSPIPEGVCGVEQESARLHLKYLGAEKDVTKMALGLTWGCIKAHRVPGHGLVFWQEVGGEIPPIFEEWGIQGDMTGDYTPDMRLEEEFRSFGIIRSKKGIMAQVAAAGERPPWARLRILEYYLHQYYGTRAELKKNDGQTMSLSVDDRKTLLQIKSKLTGVLQ